MSFEFTVINGKTVHHLVHDDLAGCVDVVRRAYLAHHRRATVNPDSYFLRFPGKPTCRIIALPAYLGGEVDVAGIKWIASFPENIRTGVPRASAVLLLNDYATGYPFACLEASIVSAARTAASATLAALRLHGGNRAKTVGIVGTGLIAKYVHRFLLGTGWQIQKLVLHDLSRPEAERFRDAVKGAPHEVAIAADVAEAIRVSDLLVLTTTASAPYISDGGLFSHAPVVLNLSLRDLDPRILLASHNVVDDVEHVMKAQTSAHLAEQLSGGRGFVSGTLAQVLTGQVRVDRSRPIVFSPFGLGILDLAVGKWVYDRAVAAGEGTRIDEFFHEMSR